MSISIFVLQVCMTVKDHQGTFSLQISHKLRFLKVKKFYFCFREVPDFVFCSQPSSGPFRCLNSGGFRCAAARYRDAGHTHITNRNTLQVKSLIFSVPAQAGGAAVSRHVRTGPHSRNVIRSGCSFSGRSSIRSRPSFTSNGIPKLSPVGRPPPDTRRTSPILRSRA